MVENGRFSNADLPHLLRQYELQIGRIEHSYNYRPIFVANFVQSTIILSRSTATSFELSDEFQPSKVPRGGGLMQTSYDAE